MTATIYTDLDPERNLLGYIVVTTEAIPEPLRYRFSPEAFSPPYRNAASAVLAAQENHGVCDVLTVSQEATRLGFGGLDLDKLLMQFAEAAPIGGEPEHLWRLVCSKNEYAEEASRPGFIRAEALWDEPEEPIEFDVQDLLVRNSQGWISGPPKGAKSYFSLHLASCLASGKALLDRYPIPQPRVVLMVQEEDPRRRIKARMKLLFSQEEMESWQGRLLMLIEAGLRLDDPAWQAWLKEHVQRHRAEVLILDVWRWLHNADTNIEKELKPVLSFLTQIRRDFSLTIIILTHDSKPKAGPEGSKASRRITGNWSQWAWAHFGWFFTKRGKTVTVEAEGKDLESSEFAFRFEGGKDSEHLRFAWQPPKLSEGEERRKRLADYLMEHKNEWIDLATLNSLVSVHANTLKKDLEALLSDPGFESWKIQSGQTKKRVYRYADTQQ